MWLSKNPNGSKAVLHAKDLARVDLMGKNMAGADFSCAYLFLARMDGANLSGANLSDANMAAALLRGANLEDAFLDRATMTGTDPSGSVGLTSPIEYMRENFERVSEGYIAYKTFNTQFKSPKRWKIEPGSVIEEVVNANRTDDSGCGINVATKKWIERHCRKGIWKVLIRWEWLPGVCVPYNTDGKIRCERVQLLEVVK